MNFCYQIWHVIIENFCLTCVYTIVLEVLDVIVSKDIFTNLEKNETQW